MNSITRPWVALRLIVGLAGGALLLGAGPSLATPHGLKTPDCNTVTGDGAFSFTTDDGVTVTPTSTKLTPTAYSTLVTLRRPGHLIGITKDTVQMSEDSGCTWTRIATLGHDLSHYSLATGAGGITYAYGVNDSPVYRISGDQISRRSAPLPHDGVTGFRVDSRNPNFLTAVDKNGTIYSSKDAARTWRKEGSAPVAPLGVYQAALDPTDREHIVLGTSDVGTLVTFDLGQSWTKSQGIGAKEHANVFSVAISPTDPDTVWAEGYDVSMPGGTNRARHIWHSTDGGLTYEPVLNGWDANLYNGTRMWPSPADTGVVFFEFSSSFGGYGTDLYRYDAGTGVWSNAHSAYDGIHSVAFHPADPTVMYLGLVEEP
jgi:hypothetical protein